MNDGNDYNAPTAVWKTRTDKATEDELEDGSKRAVAVTILTLMMID